MNARLSAVLMELEAIAKETDVGLSVRITGNGLPREGRDNVFFGGVELNVGGVCVQSGSGTDAVRQDAAGNRVPDERTPMKRVIDGIAEQTRKRSVSDGAVLMALGATA